MPVALKTMPLNPKTPLIYLITSGKTTAQATPKTEDFLAVLKLVEAAASAQIDLLQIREKQLSGRVLYELARQAADITRGTRTKLLINDRSDIASAAGADGVHLTTSSLMPEVVRRAFGPEFLIGVSTHSLAEAADASSNGADFVVFGPVFETSSKMQHGDSVGVEELEKVARRLAPFPVLALGGINPGNIADCVHAGVRGVAAIRMLNDPMQLAGVVREIREKFDEC